MYLMKGSFQTRAQLKLWGHLAAVLLATGVTAMAGARMLMVNSQMRAAATSVTGNGGKRSMSGQIALSMGAKSLLFITYQILAEHTRIFKERLRVNMILNCIEAIAWPAVAAFTVQGIIKRCTGTTCILSWIIMGLAVILSLVSTLAAWLSLGDWQYFKRNGVKPGEGGDNRGVKLESRSDESGGYFNKDADIERAARR